jgi:uncharacterized membrane protein
MSRTISIALLLIAAAFGTVIVLYPHVPDPVPVHFDMNDQPNGWMPKPWGAIVVPLTMILVALTFAGARWRVASQRGESAAGALDVVMLASLGFLLECNAVVLLASTGVRLSMSRMVCGGLGLLFVILGNSFGKLTQNRFVGIRTTRTLADPEVWLMTHRFGGRVFVIGGFVLFFAALAKASSPLLLLMTVAIPLLPTIYSYVYRRAS